MKKIIFTLSIFTLFLFIGTGTLFSQNKQVIDEVVAVVGDEIILRSDIEAVMSQSKEVFAGSTADYKCKILDNQIQKKILLVRARADSLKVSDDQVENELNRRLDYFANTLGSVQKLEEFYNKTILEIKGDFRKQVKDQMLTDQMQNKIIGGGDITPAQVKEFFRKQDKDSLPDYSTEVELSQILIYPKPSRTEKAEAIEKIEKIRADIIAGASFETKAIVYSKDDGSAIRKGDLGMTRADAFVPEFSAAALRLKKDSISPVVETKFGYHIIQLIERKGEMIHARHILIKAEVGEESREKSKHILDSLKDKIEHDTLRFEVAALKFSDDDDTRNRGGNIVDMKSNSSKVPLEELDAATYFVIEKLAPGKISEPIPYSGPDGRKGYRIIRLKSKTVPHKANLTDDYPKIKAMANDYFKQEKLDKWFKKYLPLTYFKINEKYNYCPVFEKYRNN